MYRGLAPCRCRNSYKVAVYPEAVCFTVGPPLRRRGFRAWQGVKSNALQHTQSTSNPSRRSGWTTVNRNGADRFVCGANNDDGALVDGAESLCQPHLKNECPRAGV